MSTKARLRIVVADDHPVVLRGLADLLARDGGFDVVARCADGGECLEAIRVLAPDIALIDIGMPLLNGIEVLKAVRAEKLSTRVVFLTATSRSGDILSAFEDGAHGIIFKDEDPERILDALHEIAAGGRRLPQELVEAAAARERASGGRRRALMGALSEREREVVRMVASGLSNKVIANRLDLTEGTVKNHLHNIYQKLGVANRTALALLAGQNRRR